MSQPSILISGGGIAGPVCAWWLHQAGIKTTIIERAPELRKAGQGIDIREQAREVVKQMGLWDTIKAKSTQEKGLLFIDSKGNTCASFPVDEKNGNSFTSDVEIIRGDLAQVFYDATKETCEYIFDDHVTAIEDDGKKVNCTFAKGPQRTFDLVIGADGMRSKVRRLTMPLPNDGLSSCAQWTAYFTIPSAPQDGQFAKWYNAPGGRLILLRPDNGGGTTRVYLAITGAIHAPKIAHYPTLSVPEQKRLWRQLTSDMGFEITRVLDEMDRSDDFYMQEIAQVKPPQFYRGRVALAGDAGYCPSPISGMGTSVAIFGAYCLAGELATCRGEWDEGLKRYQEKMLPFVQNVQKLPPGAPAILNPQSEWGLWILYTILAFVSWTRVATLISRWVGVVKSDKVKLQTYDFSALKAKQS
ncbi:hypothetical protein ACMFMG_010540 [Clarireedia jacksonii]